MNKDYRQQLSEREILSILTSVHKANDIPSVWYHIGGYQEEAVCLEKKNLQWIVYDGERGNHNSENEYSDLNEACLQIIFRISDNLDMEKKIKNDFKQRINNTVPTVTKNDLVELLSARLGMSDKQIERVLSILPQVIGEELQAGKRVQFSDLGTFETAKRAAYKGRNPRNLFPQDIP